MTFASVRCCRCLSGFTFRAERMAEGLEAARNEGWGVLHYAGELCPKCILSWEQVEPIVSDETLASLRRQPSTLEAT